MAEAPQKPDNEPTEQEIKELKEKTKKLSIKEGSSYSFMDGFGVRYVSPFAIALGANNTQIGFLSSMPALFGNLSQLLTPKIMERSSRKKIVFLGVLLQALSWLPLILISVLFYLKYVSSMSAATLLIIFYTLLILFGAFSGPAWASMMKDIVGENTGEYFGRRNKTVGIIALICMLVAGFFLDFSKRYDVFIGFAVLFAIAFIGRSFSAYFFSKHYEPKITYEKGYYFSFWQFVKKMPYNNFGRFVIITAIFSLATNIAGPFFVVYMFKDLHFTYVVYTITIISNSLSSLLTMPLWGKFADRYGNIKTAKITSFLIPLIPLFYISTAYTSKHFPAIILPTVILAEAISGMAWAGFNLSTSNFIYDAVTRQRMALCVAYDTVINAIGVFIGATLGGLITSGSFLILGFFTPVLFVMLLSSALRIIVALFMTKGLKEVRTVEDFNLKEHIKKQISFPGRLSKLIPLVSPQQPESSASV